MPVSCHVRIIRMHWNCLNHSQIWCLFFSQSWQCPKPNRAPRKKTLCQMLMEISYAQSGPIFPFPAESKSDKECVYRTMNTNNYFMIKLAMASDIDPPQFSRFISCVDWHVQLFNLSKEDNNGNGISLRMIKKSGNTYSQMANITWFKPF